MTRLLAALLVIAFAGAAWAQSKSAPASTAGSAGVTTRLQALHYGNVHGLRRGPDGQWLGKARQGNIEKSVTVAPDGTVVAR